MNIRYDTNVDSRILRRTFTFKKKHLHLKLDVLRSERIKNSNAYLMKFLCLIHTNKINKIKSVYKIKQRHSSKHLTQA